MGIKLTLTSNLKLIDQIKKDMQNIPMDENEAFEDMIELLSEDESFQALLKDKTFQDLMETGSIQTIMEDKSIQSLIERKLIERNNTQIKKMTPSRQHYLIIITPINKKKNRWTMTNESYGFSK